MSRSYTPEQIARVAWAVKQAMQDILGDAHVSDPWWTISPADKKEFTGAVKEVLGGMTPPELHGRWMAYKRSQGWRHGAAVDWVEKTHPYLVPWSRLTSQQRDKDRVFCAIVRCLGCGRSCGAAVAGLDYYTWRYQHGHKVSYPSRRSAQWARWRLLITRGRAGLHPYRCRWGTRWYHGPQAAAAHWHLGHKRRTRRTWLRAHVIWPYYRMRRRWRKWRKQGRPDTV